jgi:AcrR family transcriptional regulator
MTTGMPLGDRRDAGSHAGSHAIEDIVDGRTARRDRNRIAVLDAVLALYNEDNLAPSPDEVARRSGVSLRSVYRYFSDMDDLLRSAIQRHSERIEVLAVIREIGQGPLDVRIERFLEARLRTYEAAAATARASRLHAATNEIIRDQVETGRRRLRAQTEEQFAIELAGFDAKTKRAVMAAIDTLTQIETIDLYRHNRGFSSIATAEMLAITLRTLLSQAGANY